MKEADLSKMFCFHDDASKKRVEKEEEQFVAAAFPAADVSDDTERFSSFEEGTNENDSKDENAHVDHDKQRIILADDASWSQRMWDVITTFWPLGLIAFGGAPAQVGLLRERLVVQRNWLDEDQFNELFAIAQVRIYHHIEVYLYQICPSYLISGV